MSCHLFLRRIALSLLTLLPFLFSTSVQAQEEVVPLLRGEVRVADAPLSDGFVVLHKVSAESSGEVDSVRVNPDGTFQLRLPYVPDHLSRPEIFFASVEYRGLLYFGEALTEAFQLDSLYLIQAYDTLSVPPGGVQLPLSARNIFLERVQGGWTATDVLQVVQDGTRTLYSPEEGVVWGYPLPPSATAFQVEQVDMAPDAIRFTDGRLEVYSPLPPGERYLVVRYRLPQNDFVIPMPGRTDRMEILVREPAPGIELFPLSISDPVEVEAGNTFRRYAGDNLQDLEIRSEMAPEPWSLPAEWLGLLLAGLLGGAGVYGYRRRGGSHAGEAGPEKGPDREELLLAIAALDEEFRLMDSPSAPDQATYETERRELLSRLKRLS